MSGANLFSLTRFCLLLRKDFFTQYKQGLIGLGAIFGILVVVNVSSILTSSQWNFNQVFYPLTLFLGGFIFTSLGFSELNHERTRIPCLTLPASILEKFASKLAVTSIGYVAVSLVLYFAFSAVMGLFNMLVFRQSHPIFNPFDPLILLNIRIYLVTQSVILLGAVTFRGNALLKAILWLFLFAVVYTGIAWLTALTAYYALSLNTHVISPFSVFYDGAGSPGMPQDLATLGGLLVLILRILFWGIMAPLFWVIAYFRLKEMEV